MKKLLACAAPLFLLAACSNETAAPAQTIRFGLMPAMDAIPMVIAEEFGFFEAHGVDVELQTFFSAPDRDAAFQAGELDGIIADVVALGLYNEGGFDIRATGITTGSFTFMANEPLNDVSDLDGHSVVISANTAIELTLDLMLEAAGLTPDAIEKVEVAAIPARLEMVRNNQADSLLVPEPFASIGQASGLRPIGSTNDMDFHPFITAFSQAAIDEKPAELQAFFAAYNDAVEFLNTTPVDEFVDVIIERIGFPEELRDSINLPEFTPNTLPQESDIQAALDWLTSRGLVSSDFQPADLISDVATR